MSRSRPYDLVYHLFRPAWEESELYKGEKYRPTGRDLKEAKEFYDLNPDIFEEIPEFQGRTENYLDHKFEGWKNLKHPCWAFLRNYNSFAAKSKKVETKQKLRQIGCVDCGTSHDPDVLCPKCNPEVRGTKNDAMKAIQELTKRLSQ